MKIKEDLIEESFNNLIDELTDEEWNNWVMSWFDPELIVETYKNWDTETKKDTIPELKKIIKERR